MIRKKRLPAEPPDLGQSLDTQIDLFWDWRNKGCPVNGSVTKTTRDLIEACKSDCDLTLAALAGHKSEWVRFAVATNSYTPFWSLWGDGINTLGLAEDKSAWVTAAVLLCHMQPPQVIVDNLKLSRRSDMTV